ncbi:hypothetical protein BDB01DRAFT_835183 [Pilobolus umbonatus]|nr:hypothetical protein BDB01DRAFT_835183 [Pilobolus umbonatus]
MTDENKAHVIMFLRSYALAFSRTLTLGNTTGFRCLTHSDFLHFSTFVMAVFVKSLRRLSLFNTLSKNIIAIIASTSLWGSVNQAESPRNNTPNTSSLLLDCKVVQIA